jgi:hypothetical protein
MKTDWLHKICCDTAGITMHPYTITLDGEPWTMATDGHLVVALHAHTEGLDEFPLEDVRLWLAPRTDGDVLNFAKLRKWVNPEKPELCPFCNGSGLARDITYDDLELEDHGTEIEEALLCGFPLNLRLLREPFKHVEAETVRVSHLKEFPRPDNGHSARAKAERMTDAIYPLLIDGGEWRIVIMAIRTEIAKLDTLPKFP